MLRYLDPRADLTFKKIFADHDNLLISLLNAMLPLEADQQIEQIQYLPAEMVPRRTEAEKNSIVDVHCKDRRGRTFLGEMPMTWAASFKKRVLFNWVKAFSSQSETGQKFGDLSTVYSLNFVNSNMNIEGGSVKQ